MDIEEFKTMIDNRDYPEKQSVELQALWYDAIGNWNHAHQLVQWKAGADAAAVHAYLHRKEPDLTNASYWYNKAGKSMPDSSFKSEWEELAMHLLAL